MKWISASNLETWAERLDARAKLPALVGDLIIGTLGTHPTGFRFPQGDKGQIRGFDGFLNTDVHHTYFPKGISVWEFGVSKTITTKAGQDIGKKVDRLGGIDPKDVTFVFVTPRCWDNPQKTLLEWTGELKKISPFRDVLVIDGIQLEHWLDMCPAVAARYARNVIGFLPDHGVQSTDEFWREFASRYKPEIREDILLCDNAREAQAKDLLSKISVSPNSTGLIADTSDEAIAFAVAAIRKLPEEDKKREFESRSLIVNSEKAARELAENNELILLAHKEAVKLAGQLQRRHSVVVGVGRPNKYSGATQLERPSALSMAKAIEASGIERSQAYEMAKKCGRSLTVLARQHAAAHMEPPGWYSRRSELLPALMAGAWNRNSQKDREALEKLSDGTPYSTLEKCFQELRRSDDPPLDLEGDVWALRSAVDAITWAGSSLAESDFENLRCVATTVFASQFEESEAQAIAVPTLRDEYSNWLRSGLAQTLLMIATLSDEAEIDLLSKTPQKFVSDIIDSLPSLREFPGLLDSLGKELPLLAEAAPTSFMRALTPVLEDTKSLKALLTEREGDILWAPRHPHVYILWALEVLAWDPQYLGEVAPILSRMADVDPGGQLSNRPINSLRAIFLSWNPQTNAPPELRISILDRLLDDFPTVGWKLIVELLPRGNDSISSAAKPIFREAGKSEAVRTTFQSKWDSERAYCSRALALAGTDSDRWITIIQLLTRFPPELRKEAYNTLHENLLHWPELQQQQVWEALNREVERQKFIRSRKSEFPIEELQHLEAVLNKTKADNLVLRHLWLFNDHLAGRIGDWKRDAAVATADRLFAINAIKRAQGEDGVIELAQQARLPHLVVEGLANAKTSFSECTDLVYRALKLEPPLLEFSSGLSRMLFTRFREPWIAALLAWKHERRLPEETIGALTTPWPFKADTWSYVEKLGKDVSQVYWKNVEPFGDFEDKGTQEMVIHQLLGVDRPLAAIVSTRFSQCKVSLELLQELFSSVLDKLNSQHTEDIPPMLSYYLAELLAALEHRDDVPREFVAKWEYSFFPILEHEKKSFAIHTYMAEDPELFVKILCDVFKPASAVEQAAIEQEATEEQISKAQTGFALLHSFNTLPGLSEQGLDESELSSWVTGALDLSRSHDREKIGSIYVGHALAHCPADPIDQAWPHKAVRRIIENISSDSVENGIATERFNMRGVYTKDIYEGGGQERELRDRYYSWAQACDHWPRTKNLLLKIGENWDRQAKQEDIESKKAQLE